MRGWRGGTKVRGAMTGGMLFLRSPALNSTNMTAGGTAAPHKCPPPRSPECRRQEETLKFDFGRFSCGVHPCHVCMCVSLETVCQREAGGGSAG